MPKVNYVTHYRTLKFYLKMGMKLKKVHNVLKFDQAPFVRNYVETLARLRTEATSLFEKEACKLQSNATYGKFIEDVRKYVDVFMCQTATNFMKHNSSPFYQSHKIIGKKLVAVFCKKAEVLLDKLPLVGFTILEESKLWMFRLFYENIQPAYGEKNVSVILSDTDSFVLRIANQGNINEALKKIEHIMDFSNYPPDHPLYSTVNAGRLGWLKDEMKGKMGICAVCGIRSKCYSMKLQSFTDPTKFEDKNVCKGCPRGTTKNFLFDEYVQAVKTQKIQRAKFVAIRSKYHEIITVEQEKTAFTSFDDKHFMLSCSIHSRAYVHWHNEKYGDRCFTCNPE